MYGTVPGAETVGYFRAAMNPTRFWQTISQKTPNEASS